MKDDTYYGNRGLGYLVFNQPKFKPLDTVKFKAYLVDSKWKRYRKPLDVYLQYNVRNESHSQLIQALKASSPGAYVGEFVVSDTLPTSVHFKLVLKSQKKKLISNQFLMEDYLLDEIGTYSLNVDKQAYFRKDFINISAVAKDANGLYVMDGTATLLLFPAEIHRTYQDTIFIADTLYRDEKQLSTSMDTKFTIPAQALPKADMSLTAKVIFRNSNNELQERSQNFEYKYNARELFATEEADTIKIIYLEDGIERKVAGSNADRWRKICINKFSGKY